MARSLLPSSSSSTDSPDTTSSTDAPGEQGRRGFSAFTYPNYRLFWCGQLVSVTGTWMQSLAQSYLVYDMLGASPFQLGLVNVFQFAPVLLFGIPAGVVSDRLPKRSILVATQSTFALLAVILTVLVASGRVELWHVYTVATVFGITNAFDMPTRQAFVSDLVGKESVMNAIALNSTLFNTGRLVGPAIAGSILALFGPAACFGINAVSYSAVIAGLLMMRLKHTARDAAGSAGSRLRDGLSYVRDSPAILRTIVLVAFVGTFGMNFSVWIPMLASDSFGSGASTYGLLFSAMGAGSLIGALSLAFFGRAPSRIRMLGFAIALGVSEIALAYAASVPLSVGAGMLGLAIAGFSSSNAMAMANTTVQTAATDAVRGRVMAVYMTVFAGSIPFGALISGLIADRYSVQVAIGLGGLITALATIVIAWFQRARPAPITSPSVTHPS